ncbi:hypothetical protein MCEGE10_02953 [Flavobacteriaceae bacterium]
MKAQSDVKKRFQFCKIENLKMLMLQLFVLLSLIDVNAQNLKVNSNDKNLELNSKMILIDNLINESQKETALEKTKILSLIKNTQPSIYLNSEGIKKYGDNPVCLYSQSKFLENNNRIKDGIDFNSVEIIIIKIEDLQDLNSEIDASQFFDFLKLKYIYILSTIECSEKDLQKIIKNNNSRFTLLYSIQKPS